MTKLCQQSDGLHSVEKHNVQVELTIAEWNQSTAKQLYSVLVLIFFLFAQTSTQWERMMFAPTYFYSPPQKVLDNGYNYDYYNIASVVGSATNYALVQGFASSMPLVVAGFFSGAVAETFVRSRILGWSIVICAGLTLGIGFAQSFSQVFGLRLCLGIFAGFFVPAGMSLLTDYFPEKSRTKAFSVVAIGVIFGMSLNQLSNGIVSLIGWRNYYIYMGIVWGSLGVITILALREPPRGQMTFKPKVLVENELPEENFCTKLMRAYLDMIMVPNLRWNLAGVGFRFYALMIFLQYQFPFFAYF